MTQQDALRMALDFNKIRCAVMMKCDSSQPTAAYIDAAIHAAIDAYESALAEQDDEAVARVLTLSNLGFSTQGAVEWIGNKYALPPNAMLYTRPAPNTYTESDIDEAIGAVDWANTSWQQAAVEAKKLVMRFVGSVVQMEPKWICVKDRLPELGIPVLCKVGAKQHPIRVMFLTKKEWEINNNMPWESLSGSNCYSHFVTHWMPLPDTTEIDKMTGGGK